MYYYIASLVPRQAVFCKVRKKIKMFLTTGGWYSIILKRNNATVAQLAEQLIRNQQVAGSSPASSSKNGNSFGNVPFFVLQRMITKYNKSGGEASALIGSTWWDLFLSIVKRIWLKSNDTHRNFND